MDIQGTVAWTELQTSDPEAAGRFYTALIGWEARVQDMGEAGPYTLFSKDGKEIAGMMALPPGTPDGVPSHWMSYLGVADIDAATARVPDLGGAVIAPPFDIPGVGRMSVITDPTGAVVSLFQGTDQSGG